MALLDQFIKTNLDAETDDPEQARLDHVANVDTFNALIVMFKALATKDTVAAGDIDALAVTAAKLAANAVETAKIKNLAVTTAKIAAKAITKALMADGTAGKVLGFDSGGVMTELTPGGLVRLAGATAAASTSIDLTPPLTAYDELILVGAGVRPTTDGDDISIRLKTGSTWHTGGADYVSFGRELVGDTGALTEAMFGEGGGLNRFLLNEAANSMGSLASESAGLVLRLFKPNNTALWKMIEWTMVYVDDNVPPRLVRAVGSGQFKANTAAIAGIRIEFLTGTIAEGDFHLYGRITS